MPYITSAERIGIEKGIEQGIEQGIAQGIEQGIERGQQAAKKAIAQKLLAQGNTPEVVSQLTELSLSEVQALLDLVSSH